MVKRKEQLAREWIQYLLLSLTPSRCPFFEVATIPLVG